MLCYRADWSATLSYKNLDPPLLIKAPAFYVIHRFIVNQGKWRSVILYLTACPTWWRN